jgi:hypothetical protein
VLADGLQLSDAVVDVLVMLGVGVVIGATIKDTGMDTLPPLYTVTATVAE